MFLNTMKKKVYQVIDNSKLFKSKTKKEEDLICNC